MLGIGFLLPHLLFSLYVVSTYMHSFVFWDNLFSSFDSALQILDMDLDPDDQDFNSNEEGNNEVRFVK